MTSSTDRSGPARTLVVFAGVLAVALAGGLVVGAWAGPSDEHDADTTPNETTPARADAGHLAETGEVSASDRRSVATTASIDGYAVEVAGDLTAGAPSTLTLTVTRDGEPVIDLDALGHLVALRDGDMVDLHVHPLGVTDGPGGPEVRFAVEVPSTGRYGLFVDFSHGGTVRTASFVLEAGTDAVAGSSAGTDGDHGHDDDEETGRRRSGGGGVPGPVPRREPVV